MEELLEKLVEAEEMAFYGACRNEESKECLQGVDRQLKLLINELHKEMKEKAYKPPRPENGKAERHRSRDCKSRNTKQNHKAEGMRRMEM